MSSDKQPNRVFMGLPTYNGWVRCAKPFYATCTSDDNLIVVAQAEYGTSALGKVFNMLWSQAITAMEQGIATHFAMLHADIVPENNWLDALLEECDRLDADVVSAVSPIKDNKGLSSVAIDDPADPFQCLRRLTFRELEELPETFDAAAAGFPANMLLVNTGCFVADLRKPWVTQCDADGVLKVFFTIQDTIRRSQREGQHGRWEVGMNPEDWEFSRRVQRLGGRVYATKKVRLRHFGEQGYPNWGGWGRYDHDEDTAWKWQREQAPQAT